MTSALVQTIVLIVQLVENHDFASPGKLLEIGALVWVANNIAFALLFWEMDSGGAAARAHRLRPHPDFAFPQQLNPELAPDRLAAAVHRLPLSGVHQCHGAQPDRRDAADAGHKIAMFVQSMISLALIGLVIARAINLFPG